MKICRLLELDNQAKSSQGLTLNFGDHFLVKNNTLYRAVRAGAIACGFEYTLDVSGMYLALPLSQLDPFLREKKIPYYDNVTVLIDVEKKIPNTTVWDEVSDNLKRNYVFHESCHAISKSESDHIFKDELSTDQKVTKILLEESFSNACELMAVIDADQPAHRIFFEANSYINMYEDRVYLKELVSQFGFPLVFKFMLMCYLHSNFLGERLEDKPFERILRLLQSKDAQIFDFKKDPKTMKKLRSISKISFLLNPRFRQVTTGFYLRLCGFKSVGAAILNFDFLNLVETDQRYIQLINALILKVSP